MGIASVVVLKQSSFRRHLGAVCQWGRLSCKDPAGTIRGVVFTGRLRTFEQNTKNARTFAVGCIYQTQFSNRGVSLGLVENQFTPPIDTLGLSNTGLTLQYYNDGGVPNVSEGFIAPTPVLTSMGFESKILTWRPFAFQNILDFLWL